ncbi:hypothetical protein HK102_013094, partial [Quaeritorhiza haematococci]
KWIKNWSRKWLLSESDITMICDNFGSKVAYYFAFLQFYFLSLFPASVVGVLTYMYGGNYSPYYGIFIVAWSVLTLTLWSRTAQTLSLKWSTRNYSKVERIRPEFRPTSILIDRVTGERVPFYPIWKRWLSMAFVTVPVVVLFAVVLAGVITVLLAAEVFMYEFYEGPFKDVL